MEFDKKKFSEVWEKFSRKDPVQIDSVSYLSLLEVMLREQNPALFDQYNCIKQSMHAIYTNKDLQYLVIDKKDHSHENRILHYLDSFLFDCKYSDKSENCSAILDLSDEEIFVLICAIQLHDYGKTRWQITIYSLLKDIVKEMKESEGPLFNQVFKEDDSPKTNIFEKVLKKIDEIRSKTTVAGLIRKIERIKEIYPKQLSDLDINQIGYIDEYHTHNVYLFLEAVIEAKNKHDDAKEFILANIVPGDENQVEHQLFRHLESFESNHLQRIQTIASSHKAFKSCNNESTDEYFDRSGNQKWLCALLRLADSLDMDRLRVIEKRKRDLTYLLNNYFKGDAFGSMPINDNKLRTFAVWTRFLLVKQIDINHSRADNNKYCIDIVINYYRFPHADDYFFTLRYLSEKDFQDVKFLSEILKKIRERKKDVRINLAYKILNESSPDYSIEIKGAIQEVFDNVKRKYIPALGLTQTGRASSFEDFFHEIRDISQTFIPFALDLMEKKGEPNEEDKCLHLPISFHLYLFLSYFKDAKTIQSDDLIKYFGYSSEENLTKHDCVKCGIINRVPDLREYTFSDNAQKIIKTLFRVAHRHPILIKSKIDELEQFKCIMPFSRAEGPIGILTGIPGLDEVIPQSRRIGREPKHSRNILTIGRGEIMHSRNILIKGGPGTGKTTIALQIFVANSRDYRGFGGRQVLFVTFEENPTRLEYECSENFGWNIDKERILQFKMWERKFDKLDQRLDEDEKAKIAAKTFIDIIRNYHTDILFVDSLNRLQTFFQRKGIKDFKGTIRNIFDEVEMWHMTAFYLLEDDDQSRFEEYAADGIIYLENKDGERTLEIRKLRTQRFVSGKHSFKIVDRNYLEHTQMLEHLWLQAGINVFPNVRTYTERVDKELAYEEDQDVIETGIEGLDQLLPITSVKPNEPSNKGGYFRGNIILVIGSPGSGKTIFGLHFIKKGIMEKGEKCLWISFEGGKAELKFTVNRFRGDLEFNVIFDKEKEFLFHYFPPAHFNQDELIYSIRNIVNHDKPKVSRLVIDSVSELEALFPNENEFKNFMATMMHELRGLKLTSIFLYRSAEFFGFQKQTHTAISSLVDTIISLKTFDIKNQIKKGLFILKTRGREQKSNLQTMEILHERGIVVSDRGWELQGLLSGETGEIKEPYIFLKLFYENPGETKINNYLINDFRKRYPMENRLFTCVRKSHIYQEFWSFKGNYGAGHANIRIVSLNKYMIEAFRENDRLHILDGYFSKSLREALDSDTRINKYYNKHRKFDFLPIYGDFGILVFQRHLTGGIDKKLDISEDDWITLFDKLRPFREILKGEKNRIFAMPPLDNMTEFVAFFMEILWSFDGDIYWFPPFSEKLHEPQSNRISFYKRMILNNKHLRDEARGIIDEKNSTLDDSIKEAVDKTLKDFKDIYSIPAMIRINDDKARKALEFLCNLVINDYCLNPARGDFRPYAITSRKWYGDVVEFRRHVTSIKENIEVQYKLSRDGTDGNMDDQKKDPLDGRELVPLELHKLPYFKNTMKSVTNQGIWCLSIIKEALSPEIGWIFIDSMVSPEIRRMRAVEKLGFPIKIEDIRSDTYKWADEGIYNKVADIMDADASLDAMTENFAVLHYLNSTKEEFDEAIKKLEQQNCMESEIKSVILELSDDWRKMTEENLFTEFIKNYENRARREEVVENMLCDNFFQQSLDVSRVEGKINGYLIKNFLRQYKCLTMDKDGGDKAKFKKIIGEIKQDELQKFIEQEKQQLSKRIIALFITFYDANSESSKDTITVNEIISCLCGKNEQYKWKFRFESRRKKPLYCSKLVANRPYFYRFEPIIHKHIGKLFTESDKPKKDRISDVLAAIRKEMIVEIFKNPGL